MVRISRRSFLEIAAAIGATAAWGAARAKPSNSTWQERRERFPEGVASGDPDSHSVLLWTRCPQSAARTRLELRVEVAQDSAFQQVVVSTLAPVAAASDWTCRVLVGGLSPRASTGTASPIRTATAAASAAPSRHPAATTPGRSRLRS